MLTLIQSFVVSCTQSLDKVTDSNSARRNKRWTWGPAL